MAVGDLLPRVGRVCCSGEAKHVEVDTALDRILGRAGDPRGTKRVTDVAFLWAWSRE